MGACRYTSSGGDPGSNLGYMMGDIVEESEGTLLLEYHNGDVCEDGARSMVHIHFTCGAGAGTVRGVDGGVASNDGYGLGCG